MTKKRIKKKTWFLVLSLVIITTILGGINMVQSQAYTISGDSVYIDDANAYIKATPHTIRSSGYVTFNITSKVYSGDVDVVFGFDTSFAKPTSIMLYKPTTTSTEHSYICDGYFNYTLSPRRFWCYEWANNTYNLLFTHTFDRGDIPAKTAYWNETTTTYWKDYSSSFTSVNYNHGGMNKWWYARNIPIQEDVNYQFKVFVNVPFSKHSEGKYWFGIKPSGETIQQAIANNHFYAIDPWWNVSYGKKKEIKIQDYAGSSITNYTADITIQKSQYMRSDYNDLVFINSSESGRLGQWMYFSNASEARFRVRIPEALVPKGNLTIYLYYNNSGQSTGYSNINEAHIIGVDGTDFSGWAENDSGGYIVPDTVDRRLEFNLFPRTGKQGFYKIIPPFQNYSFSFTSSITGISGGYAISGLSDNTDEAFDINGLGSIYSTFWRDAYFNFIGVVANNYDFNHNSNPFSLNGVYHTKATRYGSTFNTTVYSNAYITEITRYRGTSTTMSSALDVVFMLINYDNGGGTVTGWMTNFTVFKYVYPEPTFTFGAETSPDNVPVVTLNSPVNYYNTTTTSITFNCSATDDVAVKNISLYINDTIAETVINGSDTFVQLYTSKTLSVGIHNWTCISYDSQNQSSVSVGVRWLNISSSPVTPSTTTPTPSCRYKKFGYYNPRLPWIRQENCI